jgi:hypothetical protein
MSGRTGEGAVVRQSNIGRIVLDRATDRPDAVSQGLPDALTSFGAGAGRVSRFRWDA